MSKKSDGLIMKNILAALLGLLYALNCNAEFLSVEQTLDKFVEARSGNPEYRLWVPMFEQRAAGIFFSLKETHIVASLVPSERTSRSICISEENLDTEALLERLDHKIEYYPDSYPKSMKFTQAIHKIVREMYPCS